jgi:ribosome biogenesis GTPase
MQVFGLHHVDEDALVEAFVEFRPWLGHCRFRDCRHLSEPGCAVAAACKRREINERRLASYRGLLRDRSS